MTNFWQKLKKPITALAPMDDVTDFVFREIIAGLAKPDVLFTEFTSADALVSSGRDKVKNKLLFSPIQKPVVAQLWGSNPDNFGAAAKFVEELGMDGIDINMGCPNRAIMKKSAGAALINKKSLVEEIIKAIRRSAPEVPLSIKTRLDTNPDLTEEWVTFILSQNIDALIIHGRTALAKSKDKADWDEIGKAVLLRNKINPNIVLLGNGDVTSHKQVVAMHKTYGVDGVMIGRGIFKNPWIFEKNENLAVHTKNDYIELLLTNTKLFQEKWGGTKNFENLKKFFKVYIKGFKGAGNARLRLMEARSYEEVYDIISKIER